MSEPTPLMKQYLSIKEKHHDAIVLFRLGDFYEMFGDDARKASSILQIALTTREKGKDDPLPMCGVPHFSVDGYITKLIKAGQKVALCEQIGDPKQTKGIVQREVLRVITPGTITPDQPKENAYIMSIFPYREACGVAVADISTGEFMIYETNRPIEDELGRHEPREILCPEGMKEDLHLLEALRGQFVSYYDDWYFDYSEAYKTLLRHFRVSSLDGYGCAEMSSAISAAGALITYLEDSQKLLTFQKITVLNQETAMLLDYATKRNLELLHNLKDGSAEGSLLWILDETLTPMGGRFMRNALSRPLLCPEEIGRRQDMVEAFMENYSASEGIRELLFGVQDMERLSARIIARTATPRDLLSLKNSVGCLPRLRDVLSSFKQPEIREMAERVQDLTGLRELLAASIADSPPLNARDGGVIKDSYNSDVDELREISLHGKEFIARLEAAERQRAGISSLKVGYNKVFGYYIEVTRANLSLVPQDYIRKQTLANCERFITQDLKEYEGKVLGAEERLKGLEHEIYQGIIEAIQEYTSPILETSGLIAEADFLLSLSLIARKHGYVRPEITDGDLIEIINGRHPVIERLMPQYGGERFIPNNTLLDCSDNRLLIITGPNMAGKSTFMRQTALIVLMAQMGSFVPADSAVVGIADRIFTRIGASDYITKGQSTFMVEMIETANIINNATSRSLILLDEVGRGTSTFDGISIAWSVAEQLAREVKARTLFATHYNELTELAMTMEGVKNYNILVKEWGDEVIFLRKIEKGPADKSYGIQVARLAGIPDPVIDRAKTVLARLEQKGAGAVSRRAAQLDLFSSGDPVVTDLLRLDLESLTPQKAMKKLAELKLKAEEQS